VKKYILISLIFIINVKTIYSQSPINFKEQGVIYITSLSFHNGILNTKTPVGTFVNNISIFSIHQSIGYMFNSYVSLGMGFGFEKWRYTSFIPIYADLRISVLDKRYSPYFIINAGYSCKWYQSPSPEPEINILNGATEGIYLDGGLGMKVWFTQKNAGYIAASYKIQDSQTKYSDASNLTPEITTNCYIKNIYHFIGIKIGVLF